MIECEELRHAFGDREVLHGVSLRVPEGAVYGFIGPNGAGKTTTLRVLATLLVPTSGVARVAGLDVVADPVAVRRVVGYLPDNAGVYDRVTAEEYLAFFAAAAGLLPHARARAVANVVELTELGRLLDQEVSALSKGQRQRLQLARTLLHDPRVLILDEPASDLDPRARIELRLLLSELGRMGKTILLSSHILTELADVCSWVGVIEGGRVVASGPIDEVQAALRPGQRVRLRVLARAAELGELLGRLPFVRGVRALEPPTAEGAGGVEVTYEGDEARVAELVRAVTAEGVPLVGVEAERRDLERLFMSVTEGGK
ncbi:MAG: ABC transporter ATP-binding protein [Deltaproteobacteria bacterium]|nr:ABC transporter ATP-binding protein [Deltaproteobacteria bacterium]